MAFVRCADSLCVVFDHLQFALFCEREDGIHVRGKAVEMDYDDSSRAGSHAASEFGGINIVSVRANVREDRFRAESANSASGGHKSERREEHFVAWLNATRAQRQNQSVCSRGNADTMSDTAEFGDFLFQRRAFAAQHKLLRSHDALGSRSNLCADGSVLRGEIQLRHGLERGSDLWLRGHGFVARPVYVNWVLASGKAGFAN